MRPITLIHLLASAGAALAHPATNDLHNTNPDKDTLEVFRYFEVFHDESVTTGSNEHYQEPKDVDLTAMGYVGPRTDVDKNAALNIPNEPTGNYNTLLKREHLYYGASNPWHDEAFHAPFTHYDPALCGRMCTSITKEAWALHPFINGAAAVCNMFVAYELQMRTPTRPKNKQNLEDPALSPTDVEEEYLSDGEASNRGHGTDDTLRVTQILEEHGIPCCLVGISALMFYGAGRVRDDWEICVPTELVSKASELLLSPPYDTKYRLLKPWPHPTPFSLNYTYGRFKAKGIDHYFMLVPSSEDAHIVMTPENLTKSHRGLPYPKLEVFIHRCLERVDKLGLEDVIDGSNVTEEWGEDFLDLEVFRLSEWNKRELWQEAVRNKERRVGFDKPKDVFETQYRIRGDPGPWLEPSDRC
ncbi:hypothetical protein VP1G_05713 [Cytospora mali]|uniref:Uncharacterized protein n=1 Tax=Cytospora mali TaxID=578113 RepID=A0A194V3C7_CYTMA|nr:hypothetical protein VP1G_05713 [Valsa mali var. pyri (nom. inval.)]